MDAHGMTIAKQAAAGTTWFGFYQFTRPASPVGSEVLPEG
jgi:hypothetical protein